MCAKRISQAECENCKGRGWVYISGAGIKSRRETCNACHGLGVKQDNE